jgi:hypothetical protein
MPVQDYEKNDQGITMGMYVLHPLCVCVCVCARARVCRFH